MEIFVISSEKNYIIAERLMADSPWATLLQGYELLAGPEGMYHAVKRELMHSDCFLPIIDNSFSIDNDLMLELRTALEYSKKYNKIIIPVLVGNTQVLEEIKNIYCVRIEDPENQKCYALAKRKIETIHARFFTEDTESPYRLTISIYSLSLVLCLCASLAFLFWYVQRHNITALCFAFLFLLAGGFFCVLLLDKKNSIRRQRMSRDEYIYSKQLEKKIVTENRPVLSNNNLPDDKAPQKNEINALGLMQVNLNNIEKYYKWSQEQAKSAFSLAVWMCIVGLLVFAIAVLLPTVFRASIEVAVITAIAGGLVELFAGTALVVYKSSVEQLNYYHKALHEDERFLSSVNLIGEFSTPEKKDEVLHEIIKSEISMNTMGFDTVTNDTGNNPKK